jgi:signal transduction histidine kinase
VLVATTAVLIAVYRGTTQVEELIEIPLMSLILVLVFAIAQHRSRAQEQTSALNAQLAQRLAELGMANSALHQEADARARLQEEMMRAHEHYTQKVIHDLKNPLTAIKGFLAMLHASALTSDQREMVAGAKRSSARMLDLVTDMLDVARFEEGRLALRREPTDIGVLLHDCIDELRSLIDQECRHVSLIVPPAAPTLLVDAGLLRRVMANLLSNAIKHTAPNTEIRIGGQPDGAGGLLLWVEDNGAGIPLEQQPALFERFSAMARHSDKRNSTGLGLAFCKLAVEAHDGMISVRSAPGAGATFVVTLPASQEQAQEGPAAILHNA